MVGLTLYTTVLRQISSCPSLFTLDSPAFVNMVILCEIWPKSVKPVSQLLAASEFSFLRGLDG